MVKTIQSNRLTEIDAIKGFLTIKMAASHFGFFLIPGLGVLARASVFTFAIFAFCYASGLAMSQRTKTFTPTVKLLAMYIFGGIMTCGFVLVAHDLGLPPAAGLIDRTCDVLLLQRAFPLVDLLLPFIFVSAAAVLAQAWLRELNARRAGSLAIGSLGLCLAGCLLDRTGYGGPGSELFASGFRTLQSLPIFAAGFLFGKWVRGEGNLDRLRNIPAQYSVPAFLTVFGTASWIAAIHNKTIMWNISGDPGYALAGILVAISAIAAMSSLRGRFGAFERGLTRIGQRAFQCLAIQIYGLPILATLLLDVSNGSAKMALGCAFVVGMAVWALRRGKAGSASASAQRNVLGRWREHPCSVLRYHRPW